MDAQELDAVQADLVAWGILEAGEPRLTRRARAAMARAATALREEEVAGKPRPGNPLLLASELVVQQLAPPGRGLPLHHQMLAAVELASLPEGIRGMFSGGSPSS